MSDEYHSRFDRNHYENCDACWEEHLDFEQQCRMDEADDARENQSELEDV